MKKFLGIAILFFCIYSIQAQNVVEAPLQIIQPLSEKEQIELMSLPELKLPPSYKNKSLPYAVDNTVLPYYSGLFNQDGLSCGQAACVGNAFTYEMNRLRNRNGSLVQNKYPTHFAWNWENGGDGYYGASYYHTFVLLKKVGTPDMQTYGGTHAYGGPKRWMTGYDNYYIAMQNRLFKAYAINCSTEEGILTLKHWLNDHLDGSPDGGIAIFYSQHQNPTTVLPPGTEHEGEKVITLWGSNPNHAMTITGYNDSIRWDYNDDGIYTNHIDLNNDGIIDVSDWEIGGFKMCNTFGGAYNGWMMYRTLALASNEGGIWNHTVNVLIPVKEYSPTLTAKVNLYYTKRKRIKIMAGMSANPAATQPEYTMFYPIIDYQGNDWGLQGENEENFCYLEFGLDLTEFVNFLNPGQEARFFFSIYENDPEGWGDGNIISFSVLDYTGTMPTEVQSSQTNVPIIQNGVTTVYVNHTLNFQKPQITTNSLPNANVYHNYNYQMEAAGGTPPYLWEFDTDYKISTAETPIPLATNTLSATQITLPFEFPFFDRKYTSCWITNYGLIDFSGESYNLPYMNSNIALSNYQTRFANRRSIAAFYSTQSCTKYFLQGSDYYIVRWVGTNIDVSVKLESNGKISIYYNNCTPVNNLVWSSGVSNGDLHGYFLSPVSGTYYPLSNIGYSFEPKFTPEYFNLSPSGLLTGVPDQEILAYPLNFKVTDAKGIVNKKTIPISTEGLIISTQLTTPNNNFLEWGETGTINVNLRNATEQPITNLSINLSCQNPNVQFVVNSQQIGQLNPLQEIAVNSAFVFNLNYNFTNGQILTFHLTALSDQGSWEIDLQYPVYTANLILSHYVVDDNDNLRLDIGETSDVSFYFVNNGGSGIENLNITVNTNNPFLTINQNTFSAGNIIANQTIQSVFNITASDLCPPGHVATLTFYLTGNNGYSKTITGHISIGQIIEDWESASFDNFNWVHGGDLPWQFTTDTAWSGIYSLRSGPITHNQTSEIMIQVQVMSPGSISFYRKTSCEDDANNNYDYLAFYIDGQEKARWDGQTIWQKFTYPVQPGIRTFKWVYKKDGSVNSFLDRVWIDDIEFPPIYDPAPLLTVIPEDINKVMAPNNIEQEIITISNMGGGIINYTLQILEDVPWLRNQRNISGSYMWTNANSFFAGDQFAWKFTAKNLSPDNEWIKEVRVSFPEGIIIDSITHMFDQSNDTLYLISGIPGNGGEFVWFGQDNSGWGLIHVNETAYFNVYGSISPDFEGNLRIPYVLQGEIYGAEPHTVLDTIEITNFGRHINWVYTPNTGGSLGIGIENEILLEFNTTDMLPGEYNCLLKIFSNIENRSIPISLIVEEPNINSNNLSSNNILCWPNPASDFLNISSDDRIVKIEIYDITGRKIYNETANTNKLKIDINNFAPGLYLIEVRTRNQNYSNKFVVK